MKKITIVLVISMLAISGCRKDVDQIVFNRAIEIKADKTYQDAAHNLTLKLISVADSRCPEGVYCIWEGTATAVFSFSTIEEKLIQFSLDTNPRFRTDTTINGYTIKLIDVAPYKKYPDRMNIPQDAYIAKVLISN